jgi:hypothetical protein
VLVGLLLVGAGLQACSHTRGSGSLESLKSAGETFLQRLRWRDFRGAGELILSERRERYDTFVGGFADENDLTLSDYQIEDVRLSPKHVGRGLVVARVRWVQMPSVSEQNAVITSEFVYRDGAWFLGRQDKGPLVSALSERLPDPEPP